MGEDKVLKKGLLHRRNSFGWIQEDTGGTDSRGIRIRNRRIDN